MKHPPPVHCAYCEQQLEIGDRGQVVAVAGQDCTGPRHSPRRTCARCGEPVHIDFSGVEQAPLRPRGELLRYLAPPADDKLVDQHGSTRCPVGGADGHSMSSSGEWTAVRSVLIGLIALCMAAIAFLVVTADDDSPPNEAPADLGAVSGEADCNRWHTGNGCLHGSDGYPLPPSRAFEAVDPGWADRG